ncbi:MAG: hypothetical protein ACLFV8_13490, partial [Alphaproteobacteria bacterium]
MTFVRTITAMLAGMLLLAASAAAQTTGLDEAEASVQAALDRLLAADPDHPAAAGLEQALAAIADARTHADTGSDTSTTSTTSTSSTDPSPAEDALARAEANLAEAEARLADAEAKADENASDGLATAQESLQRAREGLATARSNADAADRPDVP